MDPRAGEPDWIFFDGTCGLCHRAVVFSVRHDPSGRLFRFAPLGGVTFERVVPPARRAGLPDSLVVVEPGGQVSTRSAAVGRILTRLGGGWGLAGHALLAVPRPLRDAAYDLVARLRPRFFAHPSQACPLLPPELRARFFD